MAIAQQIRERVDALLTLSSMGGTLTATGAEQDLYVSDEPLGCHYNRTLYVDLDNMLGGDTTVFRTYYRLEDAGGWLQTDYQACVGADGGLANGNVALAIA
ncbi:MAG: hypothetical protein KKD77_22460, partial [Gammaproteobacteria bacterium]|nr:hypothetical protein [Gammaproteobacteria bacterium]